MNIAKYIYMAGGPNRELSCLVQLLPKHNCNVCRIFHRLASCETSSLSKFHLLSLSHTSCRSHSHNLFGRGLTSWSWRRRIHTLEERFSINQTWHPSLFRTLQSSEPLKQQQRLYAGATNQKEKPISGSKFSFLTRLIAVGTIAGLVWWYSFHTVDLKKEIEKEQIRYEEFKKAKLGGDWTLMDHHGKVRSSSEFHGQWVMMYFGFTHCPDICPEELEKLVAIVQKFDNDPKLPNLMPIFITLDPERDNPKVIKEYLAEFKHPRMLGFTGTDDEIREVAKKYRAYYGKGPVDEDNDYIVDHTIIIYLINPDGEFVNYYDRSRSASTIISSAKDHIYKFDELQKLKQNSESLEKK